MKAQQIFGLLIVVVLIIVGTLSIVHKKSMELSATANAEDVRKVVENFGGQLQKVSLMSPTAADDMARQYGDYLSPELLAKWQADPSIAIGREVSSPYPDRITISSVTQSGPTEYSVSGFVVERTMSEDNTSGFELVLSVSFVNNKWLITSAERGAQVVTGAQGKKPAGSAVPGDASQLTGTWTWQRTIVRDEPVVTPKKPGVFSVTFDGNGRVSGKTDCNGFGAQYMVGSDGIIKISQMASTLMYCDGSQEEVFSGEFGSANSYSFDAAGNLVVNYDNGAGSMIFSK